jgi:hypothetical protein
MGKFVLVYKGGDMGATPEEQEASMQEWMGWFGSLGSSIVDMGAPFGPSASLDSDGERGMSAGDLSGYSIIEADDLDGAVKAASGCPVLSGGGTLDVYEAMPVPM